MIPDLDIAIWLYGGLVIGGIILYLVAVQLSNWPWYPW